MEKLPDAPLCLFFQRASLPSPEAICFLNKIQLLSEILLREEKRNAVLHFEILCEQRKGGVGELVLEA